ncbi:sulfotransferase family protein [Shimia biformata]|uniref:sulfotransferase family protein n=1 Tax=Shimia biformata TaxID=1294299 RepID=UPI00194FE5F7|nr:sulfotransferase [Shimia biformata]
MQTTNTVARRSPTPDLHLTVIVGCQRSGTTLTGQILGAHPNALLLDEQEGLYTWFDGLLSGETTLHGASFHRFLGGALAKYADPDDRFVPAPDGGAALAPEITHLVLKAPNLLYRFRDLAALDVPVRIIYPVRDARPVVASMARLGEIPMVENQAALLRANPEFVARWETEIRMLEDTAVPLHVRRAIVWRIKSTQQAWFRDAGLRVFSFRYEDLTTTPDALCRRVIAQSGLPWDPAVLSHQGVFVGVGPGRTLRTRPIDQSSLTKWTRDLTPDQERDILQITGSDMETLGYDITPQVPASDPTPVPGPSSTC